MDNSKWSKETFALHSLNLWDENARFPDKYFNETEEELIEYFLSKKDFKVLELAKEIVAELNIPQLERIVVLQQGGKNIVLEGNRRLTAYKLIVKPDLAQNESLRVSFEQLNKQAGITDSFELDALVTDDASEGLRIIERKHLKSNNEVSWGDSERAHYSARKGDANRLAALKVEITKKLRETGLDESLVEEVLGQGYVTTFYRIMTGTAAANVFGYEFDDNNNTLVVRDPGFLDKLKVVVLNVLEKKGYDGEPINSRTLNTKRDITDYLSGINDQVIKDAQSSIEDRREEDLFGRKTINIGLPSNQKNGKRSSPLSSTRKHLIPQTCILQIGEPQKINGIYHELRNTIILDDSKYASPNAAAVLFRTFLESSIDWYLEKHGWSANKNESVKSKVQRVVELLEKEEGVKANDARIMSINRVASSKAEDNILSIENFHQYVHSNSRLPQPTDLKQAWDELQGFFELLWDALHRRYMEKKQYAQGAK